MRLELDTYADLHSPVHHWEPRCKFIGLMGLIFAFSGIQSLILLPIILAITLVLYAISGLPWSFLRQRLRYPGWFLLGIVIFLPFIAGETVLWEWGIFALRLEGCLAVILISVRFVCILVVALILFGTAPFLLMIKAMGQLGLPLVVGDMMLLSYRYLTEFGDRLKTLKIASRLRGFDPKRFSWQNIQTLAALIGTLLVRTYEQSERVYQAMRLRGYGNTHGMLRYASSIHPLDYIATIGVLGIALGLAIAQTLLNS
ncbi:cobalt ECF transporter T component CbiQ [Roseofilum sp. BLCC_M154]|uniref:Cobalt ECF transporter T component CbiQ n=1 Tax=Roseofilum acuticapitatum BLCC-M154 TaxID=3022444 RepID=A0ABT7AWC8_9CYAN|nr:cobalt ECF transporter T component CbiQ [Roseofilum acuticapitatum]MDJ1171225.1 cobalt ECF transporter T component CbiQ [Roseofilum acuticapitatum BLCC-M154]